MTVGELNRTTSRVLGRVDAAPLVVTRHGEPVAMLQSIDDALLGLIATDREFLEARAQAERELEREEAVTGARAVWVGRAAQAALEALHTTMRGRLREALRIYATNGSPSRPALALVSVGRGDWTTVAACRVFEGPPAVLAFAITSRAELVGRVVGPQISARQRRRRTQRVLHARDLALGGRRR